MSINKVILIGRLGQNPEIRYTPAGVPVTNFSVATNEKYKDRMGALKESTEWHKIVAWGKTAEIIHQYLTKGSQVFIEGKLQTRQWKDKDSSDRYTTEIVCNSVQFLDSGGKENKQEAAQKPSFSPGYFNDEYTTTIAGMPGGPPEPRQDDIPF
jgi:single-strand DNA-binding protein